MTSFAHIDSRAPADALSRVVSRVLSNPPPTAAREEALMAAVADGDNGAFEVLVRLHLDAIHGYLFRLTGSRDDAEDLAQETFLRLWRKAGSYEPGRVKVSTWLHTIAHNLSIDAFRRKREVLEPEVREIPDAQADPAGQVDREQQQALLETAITALPERQRAAILLCQVQGFSNIQAAEIMDIKTRALESLLARARRSLRESLSTQGLLRSEARSET